MADIFYKDKKVNIFSITGYCDGWYWDMNAEIEYDGDHYTLCDGGSGSGYIPIVSFIKKGDFDRLYGKKQIELDESDADYGYFKDTILQLLHNFFESGATESWELNEWYDESGEESVYVDGVLIEK